MQLYCCTWWCLSKKFMKIFNFHNKVTLKIFTLKAFNGSLQYHPQVTSIENYMRLCTTQDGTQQWFARSNVTAIILLIWFIGSVASGLQYVSEVSFDYCKRNETNNKTLLPFETGNMLFWLFISVSYYFCIHCRLYYET